MCGAHATLHQAKADYRVAFAARKNVNRCASAELRDKHIEPEALENLFVAVPGGVAKIIRIGIETTIRYTRLLSIAGGMCINWILALG